MWGHNPIGLVSLYNKEECPEISPSLHTQSHTHKHTQERLHKDTERRWLSKIQQESSQYKLNLPEP